VCGSLFLSLAGSSDVPKSLNKNRRKKKNFPEIRCFFGPVGTLEWPATSISNQRQPAGILNERQREKKNFPEIRCFFGPVGTLEWPATSISNQRQTAGILNERQREKRDSSLLSNSWRFYDLRVNLGSSSRTEGSSHGAGRPSGTAKDDGAQGRRPCVARSRTLSGSQDRRALSLLGNTISRPMETDG
jgi:hypothetical protein